MEAATKQAFFEKEESQQQRAGDERGREPGTHSAAGENQSRCELLKSIARSRLLLTIEE